VGGGKKRTRKKRGRDASPPRELFVVEGKLRRHRRANDQETREKNKESRVGCLTDVGGGLLSLGVQRITRSWHAVQPGGVKGKKSNDGERPLDSGGKRCPREGRGAGGRRIRPFKSQGTIGGDVIKRGRNRRTEADRVHLLSNYIVAVR